MPLKTREPERGWQVAHACASSELALPRLAGVASVGWPPCACAAVSYRHLPPACPSLSVSHKALKSEILPRPAGRDSAILSTLQLGSAMENASRASAVERRGREGRGTAF